MTALTTSYRTCPLCEATCGLAITHDDTRITLVRGDRDDVFSHGYLCPKAPALKQLHDDPDRVRTPLVRRDGELVAATWDEAFTEIERRYQRIVDEHGRDAVAIYFGNPSAHSLAASTHMRAMAVALATRQRYSASTVDQIPKHVSAGLMFGTAITIPIPDIDRTDMLVMLGANPLESNGSLFTAPDLPARLQALIDRGGELVVIDPRRTKTAELATEHLAIRPGTDAMLLLAVVNTLFDENLVTLDAVDSWVNGVDEVREVARRFPAELVAPVCGCDAERIRSLARRIASAPTAAVYGRIGTCTQEFGTLSSWLVDVVNVLTGNLDRPGGAMFPTPVAGSPNTEGQPGSGRGFRVAGATRTRVRGLSAVMGEMPVACLAEEIDTPASDSDANPEMPRVRGLVCVAGNPALSTQNSGRLAAALASLDLLVSVDLYVNETSRHAHVVLPAPSPAQKSHYDLLLYRLAIRNVGNYSPALLRLEDGERDEWDTMLRLSAVFSGLGTDVDVEQLDDALARQYVTSITSRSSSRLAGRDPDEILELLRPRTGPERVLDLLLRSGPYGDHFGANPDGISLATLEANPHGLDLGAMVERVPEVLRTPTGRIELAPPELVADVDRLTGFLERFSSETMVLVGRRDLRSNNSWMHNIEVLVKGRPRCTLHVHPDDAARLGLEASGHAKVTSRVGSVVAPVQVTDAVMPGVVSLPHGWGHDADGSRMTVAERYAGVNSNVLADEQVVDPLSGNGVLNGIPVTLTPA